MYDTILIPTDGSDASTAAVEQGVAVAERFEARVHFLHVVDVGVEMAASGVGDIADDLTETLDAVATEALDAAAARAEEAGVPHERTVLEGFPRDAIVEYSDDRDVDLVVLGASGRSGITEHLLGSTAERVAHAVDVSVLIARP
jgi:nucleotide-binding universal stress UspA family protein